MMVNRVVTNFVFYLFLATVLLSCLSDHKNCHELSYAKDDLRIYVKPHYPQLVNTGGIMSENNNVIAEDHIHFIVRLEKKGAFTEVERMYLTDKVKYDISLSDGSGVLPRSLFIYESLFPSDNLIQFIIAFARPVEERGTQYDMVIRSDELRLDEAKIEIPKYCFK